MRSEHAVKNFEQAAETLRRLQGQSPMVPGTNDTTMAGGGR